MALHRKMPITPEMLVAQRDQQRKSMVSKEEELRRAARNTFSAGDGKVMLDILIQMYYDGSLVGETVEKTYQNIGRRDVVLFLMDLLKEN